MAEQKKRTVLVIEDNEVNREMLAVILSSEYNVLEAENGQVGLDLLNQYQNRISLIMLDLQMPVMTGYEFLDIVSRRPNLANIPIIVTTSSASADEEINCLDRGATDFVSKPYRTDVVLRRASSMIRLSEASATLNRAEYDELTGVYSKMFFYMRAEDLLGTDHGGPEGEKTDVYDVMCSDIVAFKMIKDRYGIMESDRLLAAIADFYKRLPEALCGRIGDDQFAVLLPHKDMEFYRRLSDDLEEVARGLCNRPVAVRIGVYRSVEHGMQMSTACNNALLAMENVKQQYARRVAEYDENLKQKLVYEQNITDSLERALAERQFEVYYQPKHRLVGGNIGGAEALVRWIHPEYGFMNPGQFIPLFERNGFIEKLDMYVLERVCADLRVWLDHGHPAVPISVNVSRADFENPHLAQDLKTMADRYGIPYELLHIEVTESAYSEIPELIRRSVDQMQVIGFGIELDDFGSGYSSLNILNELRLDVLKLDMSLVRGDLTERRRAVLEHILAMADRLGMEVVAEGIETEEQVSAFRDMGCTYAQGYFYSKPLPKKNFEDYLERMKKGEQTV